MRASTSETNRQADTTRGRGRMNSPACPSSMRTGRNAATLVRIVATTGPPTWAPPSMAASSGVSPSSMRRKVFSPTTIASSTTMPSTTMSANMVIMFMLTPNQAATAMPPRNEMGMPRAVQSATRRSRKASRQAMTSTPPMRPDSVMTARRSRT